MATPMAVTVPSVRFASSFLILVLLASSLSKAGRGLLFPTLPTLLRIALVFGVGLEHFFAEGAVRASIAVVRKKDRLRLPDRPGSDRPCYFFESLDFPVTDRRMEAYYAE